MRQLIYTAVVNMLSGTMLIRLDSIVVGKYRVVMDRPITAEDVEARLAVEGWERCGPWQAHPMSDMFETAEIKEITK